MNCLGKVVRCRRRQPRRRNSVTVIGQISVYRPDWMRKPNCVVNDCCETDADEEQDDDRSRARLQRPLVSMMRVYALGILGRFSSSLSDGTRIASGRTVSVSAQALGFRGAARQLPVIEAITTVSRLNIDNAAHRKLWKTPYCLSPPAGITFSPAAPPGAEESPTTHKKRLWESTFIPASLPGHLAPPP